MTSLILIVAGLCLFSSNVISLMDLLRAIGKLSEYEIELQFGLNFYFRLIGEFFLSIGLFGLALHLDNDKIKKDKRNVDNVNDENKVPLDNTQRIEKNFYLGDTQRVGGLNLTVYDLDFQWRKHHNTGELIRLAKVSMVIINAGSESKRLTQADLRIYANESGVAYEQYESSDFAERTIMPFATVEGTAYFIIGQGMEKEVFTLEYNPCLAEQYSSSNLPKSARWLLIAKNISNNS